MNVFELLKNDHEKVSRIFEQLESAPASDASSRRQLFVQLKQELDLHTHAEETIFYPVLKQAAATREITLDAYEEHQEVKNLLAELEGLPMDDEEWQDILVELRENVEHHVEVEENEMFEQAREILSPAQIEELGDRIQADKQQQQKMVAGA